MKAIVLCAGYATRLYPLTRDTPKPLLEVDGMSILDHIMTKLQFIDVDEVCVITNAKFDPHFNQWAQAAGYRRPRVKVVNDLTTSEEDRRGSMGDVKYALEATGWRDGFLLINGDNLCTFSIKPAFVSYQRRGHTILTYDVGSLELARLYGIPVVGTNGEVTGFQEKPAEPASSLVSIGVYYYGPEVPDLLDEFAASAKSVDKTGDFVAWLAEKTTVYTHPVRAEDGIWFDIGTLDQLEEAKETMANYHRGPYDSAEEVAKAIRQATRALPDEAGPLGDARSFLDVVRIMANDNAHRRAAAATVMGQIRIPAGIPWLLDVLDDSRTDDQGRTVRDCAAGALVALGYANSVDEVVKRAQSAGFPA